MIKGSLWNPELEDIFRNHFGRDIDRCSVLSSHGSDRVILRLHSEDKRSAIGIINKEAKENRAFVEFSKHFRKFNLNVPQVYGVSNDVNCYVIEDLGDTTLFSILSSSPGNGTGFSPETTGIYKKVIKELIRFQVEAGATIDYSLCSQFDEFGEDNINYDLSYFKERFLNHYYQDYDPAKLNNDFCELRNKLLESKREYFLYRDFQSRNIMVKDDKLYFIDYQSGRRGALQYDLASLLYDAKADIPQETRYKLIDFYVSEAKKLVEIDEEEFVNYFWYFAVIRILQALGAYGYLGLAKGKKRFLDSIPYALKNISYILNRKIESDKLNYIKNIFEKIDERKKNQRA